MMGKSHLVANTALAVTTTAALTWFSRPGNPGWHSSVPLVGQYLPVLGQWFHSGAIDVSHWILNGHGLGVLWVFWLLAYWIGSVAPDVDQDGSMLSRYFHVDLIHRGWTHTNWVLLVLAVLSWFDPSRVTLAFTLGVLGHDFMDGLSVARRVGGYPLTPYKVITREDGSECVVSTEYGGLYQTDSTSEDVLLAFMVLIAIASFLLVWC